MDELISVIIPVYNIENYVEKCIESVLNQTYSNLEIIIVDDGSKDKCPQICDEYFKKDKRIKVIHQENLGLSEARNNGIKIANGKYIAFIDGDDFIDEDMYEILYYNLKRYDADIASCEFTSNFEPEQIKEKKVTVLDNKQAIKELILGDKLDNHVCNKLFKKKLFEEVSFPKGKKYEDIGTMYLLIEKAKKIVLDNSKKYHYINRSTSITNSYSIATLNNYIEMVDIMSNYIYRKYPELRKELDILVADYAVNFHTYCVKGRFEDMYNNNELLISYYKKFKMISKEYGIVEILKRLDKRHKAFAILLYINRKLVFYIGSKFNK